jgi:hypothetical protein
MNEVEKFLNKTGYVLLYLKQDDSYKPWGPLALNAVIRPELLSQFMHRIRHDNRFYEGPFHWLHPEVGTPRTEFRSYKSHQCSVDKKRSGQIVVNTKNGTFYADVDSHNYEDVVNTVAHLAVVLWPWRKA